MGSTAESHVDLPTPGPQAGLAITDVGHDNDGTVAPLVFLGDPYTGRKLGTGAITMLAAPTVTGSNPLTASTDGNVVFSEQVREIWVRNLTAYDCYFEPDATASTASWPVLAGETQILPLLTTILHIYPDGGAVSVNVANGLYVRGGV